jgi:hypothetical protein
MFFLRPNCTLGGIKMFVLIGETLARMDDKLLCDEDGHIFVDLDTYYINKLIESLFTYYDHSQITEYFINRNKSNIFYFLEADVCSLLELCHFLFALTVLSLDP